MLEIIKYSGEVLGWQRKPGPVNIWRVVEGRKKTEDGKTLRFSIQEIPEDRQIDVLKHMLSTFTRDEPICRSTGVINNPEALEDFRKLWSFALGQGIVVGAFLIDENNPKPILVGANMTIVNCDESLKGFASLNFTAKCTQMILDMMHQLEHEKDTRKIYNVDKYISAFGLSVDPQFRDQGLAKELLRARKEMSAVYDIQATSTVFSASAAQHIAAKVGFELLLERDFASFRKEDGSECFPGIESKSCKLMGMRL